MAIVERDGIPGKICIRCGEWKPVTGFSIDRRSLLKGRDGYLGICKICNNAEHRARKTMTLEEWRAYRAKPPTVTERDGVSGKICNRCSKWKPLTEYNVQNANKLRGGDGFYYTCKVCHRARMNAKRAANIEEHRAKQRGYYRNHADAVKANSRAYRERNPDRRKQTDLEYYERNKERRKAYQRIKNNERRSADPEGVNEYNRMRRMIRLQVDPEKERDKSNTITNRRRARKLQSIGSHTEAEWQALKARYHYTCLCCRKCEPQISLARDHIVPLSRHGSDYIDNIQPLCKSCNSSKGTKTIDYRSDWVDPED